MRIELIGCSSAGKSTVARRLLQDGRKQGLDIWLAEDFVLKQLRLNGINSLFIRKFLVNSASLIASMLTWRSNRKLYLYATRFLFSLPISKRESVGLLRNVLKKVGMGVIVGGRSREQQIILIDEGVVHVAHNLFVHLSAMPNLVAIPRFVSLIPLPDAIVYVRPPESTLVERIMKRGHRRIPDLSHENVACFVRRALATFDALVKEPGVAEKSLVVDGEEVQRIAELFHERDVRVPGSRPGSAHAVGQQHVA